MIKVYRESPLIILISLFIFPSLSIAQGPDVFLCDLKGCIKYALENRNEVKAAKLDVDMTNLGISIEESKFSPSINVDNELGYFTGNSTTPFAVVNNISDEGIPRQEREDLYYSARLNLDIPLFIEGTFFKKNAPSIRKKDYERLYKTALKESIETGIINEVTEAYFNILQQMRMVEINELTVSLKELSYETLSARAKEGLIPETDLITAEMELLNAKRDMDISKNELELKKMELHKSLGSPLYIEVEISDQPLDLPEIPDVKTLMDRAFIQRGDLKSIKAMIEMEREDIEFYKRSGYPAANLMANYTLADNFDAPVNDSWNIFMKVNIPVFDGGYNKRNASLSGIKEDMMNERLAGLYKQISQEVRDGYYEVKRLQTEHEIKEKEIKLIEKRLSMIKEKVKEKLLPEVTLKEEEIKMEIEKKMSLQLKYRALAALGRLNKATGERTDVLP